ncbi:Multidrug resistance-associated protein 1 [Mortierella sp. NVP41]|nr:Multidrug resistance-associated protein 1 [Mortierella sp. NVP41]
MSVPPSLWSTTTTTTGDTTFNSNNNNNNPSVDPIKTWIDDLMNNGGFLICLGLPALLLFAGFLHRAWWLRTHRQPHHYGRTALIYWPSQLFLATACVSLVALLFTLANSPYDSNGLLLSVYTLLLTWFTAIELNKREHRYEIRSSDALFLSYIVTLLSASLSLYILYTDPSTNNDNEAAFRYLGAFAFSIAMAFVFEAAPRSNTRVQIESRKQEHLSAYQQANLFSRWTFHFIQEIISAGAKRSLVPEDIDNTISEGLLTHDSYEIIAEAWEQEVARAKRASTGWRSEPSLMLAGLHAYWRRITKFMLIRVSCSGLAFYPTMLFGDLLQFFADYHDAPKEGKEQPTIAYGLLIATGMFVATIAYSLLMAQNFQALYEVANQLRAGTVAMVYRKSLRLSPQARQKSTLGEITNHMAVDAEKWIAAANFMPSIVTVPFELIIGGYLLYKTLGWSLLAGLAVFCIIAPIQGKMAGFMSGFEDEKLEKMDARLRVMTEILSNIKIVKLYGWEEAFRKKVDEKRSEELHSEKMLATIRSILTIVFTSVTLLMSLATFGVYATYGGPDFTPGKMTSQVIFVGIALFAKLNRPLGTISYAISQTISIRIATRRIKTFLLLEEIDTSIVQRFSRPPSGKKDPKPVAVDIDNGTFAWGQDIAPAAATASGLYKTTVAAATATDAEDERQPLLSGSNKASSSTSTPGRPTLANINLQIPDGSLTAVVGRIGQGKSSLLSALMGEMYKKQGSIKIYGDLAYVPQQPWILNATVQDNIVFGKVFDQELYDRIVFASGLRPDLEMLPAGDQTEIGERGINLSGGQKQRISLARAAYQDADIYLLDDPLSAVDAHVDQHLWQHLIGPSGLLKDKTRVLVTHGIHHLEEVDQIVVLKHGMVSEMGDYHQLNKARGAFYLLIKEYSVGHKSASKRHHKDATAVEADVDSERNTIVGEDSQDKKGDGDQDDDDEKNGELIAEETMVDGKISWKVVMAYARAVTLKNVFFCLLLFVASQACQIATNFWLRLWILDIESEEEGGPPARSTSYYLYGYAILILAFVIMDVMVNYMSEVVCGIQGSKTLHNNLITRVLRLPMSFFDTTPMGRIVNRFSSDMESIDSVLPENCNDLFSFITIIGSSLLVIAYSTPAFLFTFPPLLLAYVWVQDYFIKTSGALRRLQSVAKSPLYQHFSETLSGVSTIRVMKGQSSRFILENEARTNTTINRTNIIQLVNRWLQIRVELMGGFIVFSAAALAVLNAENLDPSLVGLALSYALSMVIFINALVRTYSEVQNLMVSVERVLEYSEKPTEAPAVTGVHLPETFPSLGRVTFKNYSARYREGLDLVVKDISFTVEPSEKVGIVGRTGAGKSSLTLALFRIIEAADSYWALASDPSAENTPPLEPAMFASDSGGSIEIDGIDISTLGLRDLRQHLAIIPQDPTLFAGTIRSNLDPFLEVSDTDLWQALERAHLKDYISSLPGGLSFEVAPNGENFSVGQRALICLARALLRKSKVLVLDEATAAVDVETDDLIQKTIRKEFKDRTILTIAHRIKTVMDSDKILVLEKGRVQEFEAPGVLLKQKQSLFYSLAQQAGEI